MSSTFTQHTMQATIITPEETINHDNVLDLVYNTPEGQKHIDKSSGTVSSVKRWKIQMLVQRESGQLETIEFYVNNGVAYVENKIINIVTEIRENA